MKVLESVFCVLYCNVDGPKTEDRVTSPQEENNEMLYESHFSVLYVQSLL
jgi:hypothetical protein